MVASSYVRFFGSQKPEPNRFGSNFGQTTPMLLDQAPIYLTSRTFSSFVYKKTRSQRPHWILWRTSEIPSRVPGQYVVAVIDCLLNIQVAHVGVFFLPLCYCVPPTFISRSGSQCDGVWRRGFWEVIRFWWSYEGGAPMMGLMLLQEEEETWACSLSLSPSCGDTMRTWPSTNQEEGSHREPSCLAPWTWTS